MWIRDGAFAPRPQKDNGSDYQDKTLLDQFGMVLIHTDGKGTLVQWSMACPNWASLMLASKLMAACAAPFTLKYFSSGWFTEPLSDASSAADRIESLIFKSDVRLSVRAYTSVVIPDLQIVPESLRNARQKGD